MRGEKHSRNAVWVPLLTHMGLVPRAAVGVGRAWSLLKLSLSFRGCWVPGRSPVVVTDTEHSLLLFGSGCNVCAVLLLEMCFPPL